MLVFKKAKGFIFSHAGLIGVSLFIIFNLISVALYPAPYSIVRNWLSDLGDPLKNPLGWVIHDAGSIIASIFLMIFYIGLSRYITPKTRNAVRMAQILGILSTLFFIAASIVPRGINSSRHAHLSEAFLIFMAVSEALVLRPIMMSSTSSKVSKFIGIYGFSILPLNVAFYWITKNIYISELGCMVSFLIYIILIDSSIGKK